MGKENLKKFVDLYYATVGHNKIGKRKATIVYEYYRWNDVTTINT